MFKRKTTNEKNIYLQLRTEFKRLSEQFYLGSDDKYAMSVVVEPVSPNAEHSFTQFKSQIETYVRKRSDLTDDDEDLIIREFKPLFDPGSYDSNCSSILLYAEIDVSKQKINDPLVIFSRQINDTNTYIGECYDVLPFKRHLRSIEPTLVIDFKKDEAKLLLHENHSISELADIRNPYHEMRRQDINQISYSQPRKGSSVFVAGISSSGEKSEEEVNVMRAFLNDIAKEIGKHEENFKRSHVLHQTKYVNIIKRYLSPSLSMTGNPFLITKFGRDVTINKASLLEQLSELNMKLHYEEVHNEIDKASGQGAFIEGVEKVVQNANLGKVHRLFVSRQFEDVPAYALNGNIYGESEEGSVKLGSLACALVHKVHTFGGTVEMLDPDKVDFDLAAILRY